MLLSTTINDAFAGIEIVLASAYEVPDPPAEVLYATVLLYVDVPSIFATIIELILNTCPDPALFAINIFAVVFVGVRAAVFPVIVETATILGAVIYYPPKIIDIAMALPVVAVFIPLIFTEVAFIAPLTSSR